MVDDNVARNGPHHEPLGDTPDPTEDGADRDGLEPAGDLDGPDPQGRRRAGAYARQLAGFVLFIGIALAVAGVVLVINQLTQPGGSVTVTVPDPQVMDIDGPDGLPDGTFLDVAGALEAVDLQVSELPPALRAMTESESLVAGLLVLVAAILLRRVLLEIAHGRPFAPVVSRRLAGLAVTVLALALLPQAADTLATVLVLNHLGHDGAGSPIGFTIFELEVVTVLVAMLLGVASRVFQHGQRLTAEVEGLV